MLEIKIWPQGFQITESPAKPAKNLPQDQGCSPHLNILRTITMELGRIKTYHISGENERL